MDSPLSCREWLLAYAAAAFGGFFVAAFAAASFVLAQPCSWTHFKALLPLRFLQENADNDRSSSSEIKSSNCCAGIRQSNGSLTETCCPIAYHRKDVNFQADCNVLNETMYTIPDTSNRSPSERFSDSHLKDIAVSNGHSKPDPFDLSKRKGYLSWDDYFMAIAFLSAHRSKDPNRQVGACLVSQDRVILGIGYNGFPRGCSDDELPWAKMSVNGDPLQTKYPYVCHAEVNAILNKNHASASGQRLYVTMFPCNECAKVIIQAGVAEVVYYIDKKSEASSDYAYSASRKLLSMAGVKVWQHRPTKPQIVLEFK